MTGAGPSLKVKTPRGGVAHESKDPRHCLDRVRRGSSDSPTDGSRILDPILHPRTGAECDRQPQAQECRDSGREDSHPADYKPERQTEG